MICLARSVRNFRLSHVTGKYPLANILVEQTRKTYVAYVINVAHKFLSTIQRLKTLVFGIWSVRSWRLTEVRIFTGGNAFSGTIFFICSSALSALMFKSVEHMIIKWGKSTFVASYGRLQRRFIMCVLLCLVPCLLFLSPIAAVVQTLLLCHRPRGSRAVTFDLWFPTLWRW